MKTLLLSAGLLALAGGLATAPVASATAPPPSLGVSPATVLPGQALTFKSTCAGNSSPVTSPGLAAPVSLHNGSGAGKAGSRPGHYTASFSCTGAPGMGNGTATAEFTVACSLPTTKPQPPTTSTPPPSTSTGEPPTGTPAPTSRPAGTDATTAADTRCAPTAHPSSPAGPPQVKVRPQGAPETGDGSRALG